MKFGICGCGCARKTEISDRNLPRCGWIKGKPKPFLPHHSKNRHVSKDGVYKKCCKCSRWKKLYDFHRKQRAPDGCQEVCKTCSAEQARLYRTSPNGRANRARAARTFILRSYYDMTRERYMAMHEAQSGLCAICRKPETSTRLSTTRRLCVDHDHRTGKTRELLCAHCNHGLGKFNDDPELLEAAAAYLRKHR